MRAPKYSPHEARPTSIPTVATPGQTVGRTTFQSARILLHPSIQAPSSRSRGRVAGVLELRVRRADEGLPAEAGPDRQVAHGGRVVDKPPDPRPARVRCRAPLVLLSPGRQRASSLSELPPGGSMHAPAAS